MTMLGKKTKKKITIDPFPQTALHKLVYRWLTIFKDDGDLWNILTALRSCDRDGLHGLFDRNEYCIKSYTTERIRAVLGLDWKILGKEKGRVPAVRLAPLLITEQEKRERALLRAPGHFRVHYKLAVEAIRLWMGYDLTNEKVVKQRNPQSRRK